MNRMQNLFFIINKRQKNHDRKGKGITPSRSDIDVLRNLYLLCRHMTNKSVR